MTTPGCEVAHDVAEVLLRHHNIDLHDRLEQVRLGLLHAVLDRHRTGDVERHLARVNGVVRTIDQRDCDVDHRIAGSDARLNGLADALLDRGYVLPRGAALRALVLEDEPRSRLRGANHDLGVAVLAFASGVPDDSADPRRLA